MPKNVKNDSDKIVDKSEQSSNTGNQVNGYHWRSRQPSSWLVAIIIILVILSVLAFGAMLMRRTLMHERFVPAFSQTIRGERIHRGMFSDGKEGTLFSGVVVSTKDNGFVIAGNGQQTTVSTSDNTTFNIDSNKVSVNDSVIIIGTKSGTTITATSVRIINN